MPDRRGDTLLEDLPEEIMDMILTRLSSKDVGRCRVVSTSWRSATSTPKFMLEHHRRQPSLPIINGRGRPASFVVFGAGTSNQQLWPYLPRTNHFFDVLQYSCDGFFILHPYKSSRFYMCNPVMRKHALLPQPQVGKAFDNTIIGFYCHHPTEEYRVLWVSKSPQLSKSSLYIFTVGSDEPRHVIIRMPAVLSPSVEHNLLMSLRHSSLSPPPVHHRGCLHWCPCYVSRDITGSNRDIIVFDTEAESFRWMRSPIQPCHYKKLFDMEGMLAFCGSSFLTFTSIDVWVMQDYAAEIWAFKYRIDVSTVEASRQLYLTSFKKKRTKPLDSAVECFNDMAMLNGCELLIQFNGEHVLRCDIDGKFLGIVNLGKSQYCMSLTHHRLKEIIVPIPAHGMQEEDEEPWFFRRRV